MNTIKNLFRTLFIALCSLAFAPSANAEAPEPIRVNAENFAKLSEADQARVLEIVDRLDAIGAMDRSSLSREERRSLSSETRDLKREATAYNRGGTVVYISVGTLLIILLIILLLR